jgi:protein-S-isoprenylcysteine O-methyltransferase Ste14
MFIRHLGAIAMLPFTVTFVVPALLIGQAGAVNLSWGLPFPLQLLLILLGFALIAGGLSLLVMTVRMFATVGQGTLAPWDPTRRLVVMGVYRYVRNPMISGVMAILFGEAALLGLRSILIWALIFTVVNMIYIPLLEEPGLRGRFGADYDAYTLHVPRWLPRRTPWTPS